MADKASFARAFLRLPRLVTSPAEATIIANEAAKPQYRGLIQSFLWAIANLEKPTEGWIKGQVSDQEIGYLQYDLETAYANLYEAARGNATLISVLDPFGEIILGEMEPAVSEWMGPRPAGSNTLLYVIGGLVVAGLIFGVKWRK